MPLSATIEYRQPEKMASNKTADLALVTGRVHEMASDRREHDRVRPFAENMSGSRDDQHVMPHTVHDLVSPPLQIHKDSSEETNPTPLSDTLDAMVPLQESGKQERQTQSAQEQAQQRPADPPQQQAQEQPADPPQQQGKIPPADPPQQQGEIPPADPPQQQGETPPADPPQQQGKIPPADPTQQQGKIPPADPTQQQGETPPADPPQQQGETPPPPQRPAPQQQAVIPPAQKRTAEIKSNQDEFYFKTEGFTGTEIIPLIKLSEKVLDTRRPPNKVEKPSPRESTTPANNEQLPTEESNENTDPPPPQDNTAAADNPPVPAREDQTAEAAAQGTTAEAQANTGTTNPPSTTPQ